MSARLDQFAVGRKIRAPTAVDTFSRFSPAVDPRFNYQAERVVAALERVCAKLGYPKTIRVMELSKNKGLVRLILTRQTITYASIWSLTRSNRKHPRPAVTSALAKT